MPHRVYILYSEELSSYYTGMTSLPIAERLMRHLSDHSGFTSKAKDWKVVFVEEKEDKSQAFILERRIKKRGAKRYLEDLTKKW